MATSVDSTLAKDLNKLRKKSAYKEFQAGYFHNIPELGGWLYKFHLPDTHIYLIVNTTGATTKDYYENKDYYFMIRRAASIDAFLNNIYNDISDLLDTVNAILDRIQANKDEAAGGVPHGYKINDKGEIVIDPIEAPLVKKIFKTYTQVKSVHKVADILDTNFSHVRDVLHDYRYERMQIPIIPSSLLKKVKQLMDANRKNRTT